MAVAGRNYAVLRHAAKPSVSITSNIGSFYMDIKHWHETAHLIYMAAIHGNVEKLRGFNRCTIKQHIDPDWAKFLPIKWSKKKNCYQYDKEKAIELNKQIGATFHKEDEEQFRKKLHAYWKGNSHFVEYQHGPSELITPKISWSHKSRLALYKELVNSKCTAQMPKDNILSAIADRLGIYSGIGGIKAQINSCLNGSDATALKNRKAAKEAGWL